MRFYNYLSEDIENDLYTKLKERCIPYLQEMQRNNYLPLYSGRDSKIPFFIKRIRKDRKPLDTPEGVHNLFNKYFKEKFGYNLRNESIFLTMNRAFARGYGDIHVIFPTGRNYEIYYNPEVMDLYITLEEKI